MNRAFRACAIALVGVVLAAVPVSAETDADGLTAFSAAVAEVERDNAAHTAAVASQATTGNITCRSERPAFVSQPEVNGRVVVRGEDTAASAITCADALLEATDIISGQLYVEYQDRFGNWIRISEMNTPMSGRMTRGIGVAPGVVDYIFPANHPSQGRPHKACVEVYAPNRLPAVCTVLLSTSLNANV
jgi:hypothetical protein